MESNFGVATYFSCHKKATTETFLCRRKIVATKNSLNG